VGEAIITRLGGSNIQPPTTSSQSIFIGATIPLTYKGNTRIYENNYEYKSNTHNITITGLEGRATITGNGTKSVTVAFDVSSSTSSLKNFTITCVKDAQTLTYQGLHAHYGVTTTGILTFAYTNIPKDGSEGTIGNEYLFIDTPSTDLPYFASPTTLWNNIYSYQVLNTLTGNFSKTSIGNYFLQNCYSFNQPLTIPSGITSIATSFLQNCYTFNQPLTIPSDVTSIGAYFLQNCYTFNQPLTIPSDVTSIGSNFLSGCCSFNQPLTIPSDVTSIGDYFLYNCYSLSTINYNTSVYPTDNNSLSQTVNSKTSATGSGIKVYGTNRAGLLTALPNRTATPFRKLIDGGS